MKTRRVVLSARAERQLVSIFRYIARKSSRRIAARYTEAIRAFCHSLGASGTIGEPLSASRRGLRRVGFRRSATIVFEVLEEELLVAAIFYRGRDAQRSA